jgi:hypothetical protein
VRITDVRAVVPRGTNEPRDWRTAMAQWDLATTLRLADAFVADDVR